MRPRFSALVLATCVALGVTWAVLWSAGMVTDRHWAETLTGEASPTQQAKALVGTLRQRPVPTADFVPTSHAGVQPLGANTFFEQEVEEWKVRRSMELLREAGVRWIRQEFPWDRIEPSAKGRYQDAFGSTWTTYDRIVRLAQEYGIEVVPRLTLPPNWTRVDNSVPRAPPDDYRDYGDFVATVVERYRGRVRYYQLWNEPNTVLEWGTPPNAADFVLLLRIGYERAKQADPTAVIIAPALSPTIGTPDGANLSDLTFLQEMYDHGAARVFDIMSAQGYGLWTGPGDRRTDAYRTNFARVQLVRDMMLRNGDGHKPIWLAEMGWSALPLDFTGEAIHGRVTDEQQARYTAQGLERIQAEWPWVGVTFLWHFRRVADEQRDQADFYFRMVDPDFTLRPVYHAVRAWNAQPSALHYGWRAVTHPVVKRTQGWQPAGRVLQGARVTTLTSGSTDDTLRLRFQGRQLLVQLAPLQSGGSLAVRVDGEPAPNVRPRPAGTEQTTVQVVPATGVLADSLHTVELRPGGDGLVEVAGFQVLAGSREPLPPVVGACLLGLALLTLTFTLRAGASRAV